MPRLTSPVSSPSLRIITHARLRPSYPYFSAPPVHNAPHPYHPRIPPAPQSSLDVVHHSPQPNLGSPLVGCLKHTQHISGRPPVHLLPMPTSNAHASASSMMGEEGSYHTGEYDSHAPLSQPHSNPRSATKSAKIQEKRRAPMGTGIGDFKVSNDPVAAGPRATRGVHTSTTPLASVQDPFPTGRETRVPSRATRGPDQRMTLNASPNPT